MERQRIGIFAGTFNPVHHGHVAFAFAAIDICHLDRVIFLPESQPRRKNNVTPIKLRAARLGEVLETHTSLGVVTVDDKNFTVANTLPKLQQLFPNANITFLVGSDVALQLKEWDNIKQLLKTCSIAIGLRSQHDDMIVQSAMENLQTEVGLHVRYKLIKAANPHMSSSQLK
jgi:nicotinate-nucleotide adenylyltransferase